jgi:acetyl esterase/lipase
MKFRTLGSIFVAAVLVSLIFGALASLAAEPMPTASSSTPAVVPIEGQYQPETGVSGRCNVYVPSIEPPKSGFPAVLVIHGGSWVTGDKWTMGSYCQNLAREGFVAVSINYRHAPTFKFPAQADDVRDALVWMSQSHEKYRIDVERIGAFGYSAGGHLAALIGLVGDASSEQRALTTSWPANDARWKKLPKLKAVCAGGPPCDFRPLPLDNTTMTFFLGGSQRELPNVYQAASPITHVTPADPPVQIIHGDKDFIVPFDGSQEMLRALRAAGVDSHLERVPDQGHMVTFVHPTTNSTMLSFFRRTLTGN